MSSGYVEDRDLAVGCSFGLSAVAPASDATDWSASHLNGCIWNILVVRASPFAIPVDSENPDEVDQTSRRS